MSCRLIFFWQMTTAGYNDITLVFTRS